MVLFGPLAILGMQLGASVGSSLLGNLFGGGGSRSNRAYEQSLIGKSRAETAVLDERLSALRALSGYRDDVRTPIIDPDTGKPLVLRLPGPGGISSDEWSSLLERMVGATDFGGMRDIALLKDIAQLASGGSNSAGAAASQLQANQNRSAQNASGAASFINDAAGKLIDIVARGSGPTGGPSVGSPGNFISNTIAELPTPPLDFNNMIDPTPLLDAGVNAQIVGGY